MDEPTLAPAPDPQSRKATEVGTSYLVLKKSGDGFDPIGHVLARTPEKAVTSAVETFVPEQEQAGTYVAVVAKRWQTMTIEPKVERSLILKAVKS